MPELSGQALDVWEAFNQDEAGVFVDYGNKLANALRALAPLAYEACEQHDTPSFELVIDLRDIYDIADELEGRNH